MSKHVDVTEQMRFENPDDEHLPIIKCVCGYNFEPWHFIISIYDEFPSECPVCERKFFFRNAIRIYQVVDE